MTPKKQNDADILPQCKQGKFMPLIAQKSLKS
jgi:hypothetical protein